MKEPTSASVKDFFALASTTQLNRATPQLSDSGIATYKFEHPSQSLRIRKNLKWQFKYV